MSSRNSNPLLYYRTAQEAAQLEREGDYRRAVKVWLKASRLSRNRTNQHWSENRSDFCLMQIGREQLKEAVSDGLCP